MLLGERLLSVQIWCSNRIGARIEAHKFVKSILRTSAEIMVLAHNATNISVIQEKKGNLGAWTCRTTKSYLIRKTQGYCNDKKTIRPCESLRVRKLEVASVIVSTSPETICVPGPAVSCLSCFETSGTDALECR